MILVVTLTVRAEAIAAFRAFETKAAAIMRRYGGAIERAIFIPPPAPGADAREGHIVSFPDAQAFAAYRADPELAGLAALRAESVVATEVLIGEAGPRYDE